MSNYLDNPLTNSGDYEGSVTVIGSYMITWYYLYIMSMEGGVAWCPCQRSKLICTLQLNVHIWDYVRISDTWILKELGLELNNFENNLT